MKNSLLYLCMFGLLFFLISWGKTAHQTIGSIAEKHLSAQSKSMVKLLLNDRTLGSTALWADETKKQSPYQMNSLWHNLTFPKGLSYNEFKMIIMADTTENMYHTLLKNEELLASNTIELQERTKALKHVLRLVGDLHQPMHLVEADNRVIADNSSTNKIIDYQGLAPNVLADKLDKQQLKHWPVVDSPIIWLYESYKLSETLSSNVKEKNHINESNLNRYHVRIINDRLHVAGLRLALLLNKLFEAPVYRQQFPPATKVKEESAGRKKIDVSDVLNNVGQYVEVSARAFSQMKSSGMVLINLGGEYPHQKLTLVLKGEAIKVADSLILKNIFAFGRIIKNKEGQPEMVVYSKGVLKY